MAYFGSWTGFSGGLTNWRHTTTRPGPAAFKLFCFNVPLFLFPPVVYLFCLCERLSIRPLALIAPKLRPFSVPLILVLGCTTRHTRPHSRDRNSVAPWQKSLEILGTTSPRRLRPLPLARWPLRREEALLSRPRGSPGEWSWARMANRESTTPAISPAPGLPSRVISLCLWNRSIR